MKTTEQVAPDRARSLTINRPLLTELSLKILFRYPLVATRGANGSSEMMSNSASRLSLKGLLDAA